MGTGEREREEESDREREREAVMAKYPDFVKYSRTDMVKAAPDAWNSLDEARMQKFLTVPSSDLATFCREIVRHPWLVGFLSDAIAFFELHGTWEMYLCPDHKCLRLFQDDESLITHLKCEHFPQTHPVAWPTARRNLAVERRCADALSKMVWKPIVIETALDLLSSMCLDDQHGTLACEFAYFDWLCSLHCLYSEDPERKRLLVELEKEFQVLLAEHHQVSFSLLSDGYFSKITALASKHIFDGRPLRFNTHLLQGLLACSPLSFCLLKAVDLSRFVEMVKTMSQFVKRHKLSSTNQVLSDHAEGDVSWSKSEILDVLSFSSKESLFRFHKAEPLCSGDRVSILSLLCNGACIPDIPRVPSKAKEIFSCVLEVMNELRECETNAGPTHQINSTQPCQNCCFVGESCNRSWTIQSLWGPNSPFCFGNLDKADSIASHFQSQQNRLQLVNRLLCLESQLRKLCALDCRMYILPLMKSFLRLKLYFYLRFHRRKMREENPAAQLPMIPNLEDYTEQQVSCEESESDCDSDSDPDLDDVPWRANPILHTLGSTLSDSATGETEGSGPLFWVAISDVLICCEKDHRDIGKSVREGIRWFKLNRTWKYWLCYTCDRKFIDRESHMVHLENEHQLCIAYDEYWLIPQQDGTVEGGELKQDVAKGSDLVDSITLDRNSYDYFLVDSTKFYEMPSANEEGELGRAKRTQCHDIVHNLQNQLSHLRRHFGIKREILKYLEAFSLTEEAISTCHFPFRFCPQLFKQANCQGCDPLSNYSMKEALKEMKHDLITELRSKDLKILREVDQINKMKRLLSDLCLSDYRTECVLPVGSLLHAKFRFDNNLRFLECNNVKEFLSTVDQLLVQGGCYSLKVAVLSPGKAIMNAMENNSSWAFAFVGIRLKFVGNWFGKTVAGSFNFAWWSTRSAGKCSWSGSVTREDSSVNANWLSVKLALCRALSSKLLSLVEKYTEQICE